MRGGNVGAYPELRDPAWLYEARVVRAMSGESIARKLGCHANAVRHALARYGIRQYQGDQSETVIDHYGEEQIMADARRLGNWTKVAKEYQVQTATVFRRLIALGAYQRAMREIPVQTWSPVEVAPPQLAAALRRHHGTVTAVARDLGVSPSAIRKRIQDYGMIELHAKARGS
jgi:transposase-like protein